MSVLEAVHSQWGGEPTVVLSRRVRPGCEAAFEAWAEGFSGTLGAFPGCRACKVVPPVEGAQAEWVFVCTFGDSTALRTWIGSETRRRWLDRVEPMVEATGQLRVISGLETLFGLLPPDRATPPPVWKLAVVTLAGLYPTVILSGLLLAPRLQPLPLPIRALLSALAMVLVMTWMVMPLVTRLFRRWLFPVHPDLRRDLRGGTPNA